MHGMDQTKNIVMMTKEGSNYILKFMTRGAGSLVQGRDHMNHIVNIYHRLLYQYTAILRDYHAAFLRFLFIL